MNFSISNGFYPSNESFNEFNLKNLLTRNLVEEEKIEKELYDDKNSPLSEGLESEKDLHKESGEAFFKGTKTIHGRLIDFDQVTSWYRTKDPKDLVHPVLTELTNFYTSEKFLEKPPTTQANADLLRKLAMKEAIKEILPLFEEEKKVLLMVLEIERCTSAVFQKQFLFRRPMLYDKTFNELKASLLDLPKPTTVDRFQFCEWFDDVSRDAQKVENTSYIAPESLLEKKEALFAFSNLKDDSELADMAKDILRKLDRDALVLKTKQCLKEVQELYLRVSLHLIKKSIFPIGLKWFPFFGLILNIMAERDKAIGTAVHHQKDWPNLLKRRFSLMDRVHWKYSHIYRFLAEDALQNSYFFERQNRLLNLLKERYGHAGETLFAPHFIKVEKSAIPLNLLEFSQSEVEKKKGKSPQPKATVVQKKSQSESSSSREPPLPKTLTLTPLQERLNRISQFHYSYDHRLWRWFAIDPAKDLSEVRKFKDRGELTYQAASDEELLKSWQQHSFPAIEIIYQDPDFKKRFTRDNKKEDGLGFWMMCRLEMEKTPVLDGRVRIGFYEEDGKTIMHRFFNPGNETGVTAKQLKSTLKDETLKDEGDVFYQTQKQNQWFFKDQLLEVEGEGAFERIRIRQTVRKMTLIAIQIPSWIK